TDEETRAERRRGLARRATGTAEEVLPARGQSLERRGIARRWTLTDLDGNDGRTDRRDEIGETAGRPARRGDGRRLDLPVACGRNSERLSAHGAGQNGGRGAAGRENALQELVGGSFGHRFLNPRKCWLEQTLWQSPTVNSRPPTQTSLPC